MSWPAYTMPGVLPLVFVALSVGLIIAPLRAFSPKLRSPQNLTSRRHDLELLLLGMQAMSRPRSEVRSGHGSHQAAKYAGGDRHARQVCGRRGCDLVEGCDRVTGGGGGALPPRVESVVG